MIHFQIMKNSKILAIFIVLILALSLVLASCDKTGEETTAPAVTDAPATDAPATDAPTEPADETTSAPETTKVEETTKAPETTKAEETTEAPHTHSFGAWNTVKAASCT